MNNLPEIASMIATGITILASASCVIWAELLVSQKSQGL